MVMTVGDRVAIDYLNSTVFKQNYSNFPSSRTGTQYDIYRMHNLVLALGMQLSLSITERRRQKMNEFIKYRIHNIQKYTDLKIQNKQTEIYRFKNKGYIIYRFKNTT